MPVVRNVPNERYKGMGHDFEHDKTRDGFATSWMEKIPFEFNFFDRSDDGLSETIFDNHEINSEVTISREAEIQALKQRISEKITKLKCISDSLSNISGEVESFPSGEFDEIDDFEQTGTSELARSAAEARRLEVMKEQDEDMKRRKSFLISNEDYEKYYKPQKKPSIWSRMKDEAKCKFERLQYKVEPYPYIINEKITDFVEDKKSIWNKVKSKTRDLYYKAGMYVGRAMFAAGNFEVGSMLKEPELKVGENLVEYERRVRLIGMAKVIGLTALSVVAVHGVQDLISASHHSNNIVSGGELKIDHSQLDHAINSHATISNVDSAPNFSFDAFNVDYGEGWFDTMSQMGITDSAKQVEILQRVGPQLQNMGLAYPIDGGSWGISNPGQLPKEALDLIWSSR